MLGAQVPDGHHSTMGKISVSDANACFSLLHPIYLSADTSSLSQRTTGEKANSMHVFLLPSNLLIK